MADLMDVAVEGARAGGEIVRRDFGHPGSIEKKDDRDLVTETDLESEREIVSIIRRRFPDHAIVAEESTELRDNAAAEYCWFVDPLDGTTNFSHGFPHVAVSIGLVHMQKPVLGIVYNPIMEEFFQAQKGSGAFLNGRKIRVSLNSTLQHALLATGFPYDMKADSSYNMDHFINFERRVQAVRRIGAAAVNLAYVACGRFDSYWESRLGPWDICAGSVIVIEAGGWVTDFRGQPFRPGNGQVLASNGIIHENMLEVLSLGTSGMNA